MKNLFLIVVFITCTRVYAQNVDSSIVIDRSEEQTQKPKTPDKSLNEDLQKNRDFQNNINLQDDRIQMKLQNLYQKESLIKDESELKDFSEENNNPLSNKAIIKTPLEADNKKRLVTGPSQYDSRIELRQLNPLSDWQKKILDRSASVGIVIEKSMIHKITDSIYQLDISTTIGQTYNLCPGEAFNDQPAVGIGTAFIIDEKSMLTAGHVFNGTLDTYAIVFGFEMINKVGAYEALIPAKDIYYPQAVKYNSEELDVTMFSVDRSFDRPVLKWSASILNPINTSVYMIGHPMGIPKKVALNASIQNNDNRLYFYTSLDAFQGNSGSPVFRLDTHEVIGILVSGEIDYKWNGSCNGFTICSIPFCKGEKVIRIEEVMDTGISE